MTNRSAAGCRTLAEIRLEIDRIDRVLVGVLAERQTYIERAAEIKSERAAVRDQARIDDVVSKVLAAAETAKLSAGIAEPVWRLLIERCIAHELAMFDRKLSAPDSSG